MKLFKVRTSESRFSSSNPRVRIIISFDLTVNLLQKLNAGTFIAVYFSKWIKLLTKILHGLWGYYSINRESF